MAFHTSHPLYDTIYLALVIDGEHQMFFNFLPGLLSNVITFFVILSKELSPFLYLFRVGSLPPIVSYDLNDKDTVIKR